MKSSYLIRAYQFLKSVYPYIKDCENNFTAYERAINQYNKVYKRNVKVSHGTVRVAFITSDYVIKFDYNPYMAKRYGGCEDEVEFYNFVKQEGYAHLFAPIIRIFFNDRMWYIMPRIKNVGLYENEIDYYLNGDDLDFVNQYLYDMHNENYGWKNGYPVIIDYALNVFFRRKRGY